MHQVQFGAALFGDRATEHSSPVAKHEIDFLRRDLLCRDDEIAFVLTILIIHYDDELTRTKIF